MKRGAIFDMDGTLFDTEKFYVKAWTELADFFGVERVQTLGIEMSGMNREQALLVLAKYYPQVDGQKYFDKVIETVSACMETDIELLPGAREILDYCRAQKVLMSVASGSPRSAIEKNLRRTGIREYFTAVVGGDEILNGKPAPDIFLLAAEQLNLSPAECYVFEDSFNGIISAHRAGCVPVMIPNQLEPSDDIRKLCAGVYKNFFEAQNAIERQEI